jgi:hypothetical protein
MPRPCGVSRVRRRRPGGLTAESSPGCAGACTTCPGVLSSRVCVLPRAATDHCPFCCVSHQPSRMARRDAAVCCTPVASSRAECHRGMSSPAAGVPRQGDVVAFANAETIAGDGNPPLPCAMRRDASSTKAGVGRRLPAAPADLASGRFQPRMRGRPGDRPEVHSCLKKRAVEMTHRALGISLDGRSVQGLTRRTAGSGPASGASSPLWRSESTRSPVQPRTSVAVAACPAACPLNSASGLRLPRI